MWQTIWLVATSCNLILKIWKCNTRNIGKCNSASIQILMFVKCFYIYKLIHINLKLRALIASFLLAPLLKTNINDFFCFIGLVLFTKKRKEFVVYWCSSPLSYCSKQNSKVKLLGFDAQSKPDVFKMFLR